MPDFFDIDSRFRGEIETRLRTWLGTFDPALSYRERADRIMDAVIDLFALFLNAKCRTRYIRHLSPEMDALIEEWTQVASATPSPVDAMSPDPSDGDATESIAPPIDHAPDVSAPRPLTEYSTREAQTVDEEWARSPEGRSWGAEQRCVLAEAKRKALLRGDGG